MKKHLLLYSLLIASAVATRLAPHAWNFAPVTAIAIVAAIYLPFRHAIALPLVIRFFSDAIIGFFSWPLMIAVYLSHLFGVLMGVWVKKHKTPFRVLAAPVISAGVFFLATNFAFLYHGYTHDLSGILLSYTNGLPFLRGTLLGDVVYTAGFVAAFEGVLAWQKSRTVASYFKLTR